MQLKDLDFAYPERLVATERAPVSRVMLVTGGQPRELASARELLPLMAAGDLLVVNDTRVLKRRLFAESGLEILFLTRRSELEWEVLCPASRWREPKPQLLPEGVELTLVERGRPQVVRTSRPLDEAYFLQHGEMPLPPYIQKARGERRNRADDASSYQTAWAEKPGSLAAPTASLHFSREDLRELRGKGVNLAELTLHVGLGTFLPVTAERLEDHRMHAEKVTVPAATWRAVLETRARGGRVWALGTTVARSLEAAALGKLAPAEGGGFGGETDLFIRPGFEFKAVDVLLTNFHQPQSTLLALVAAFAGLDRVKACYEWAIGREFRLFSYGDLTVWMR